MDFKKFTQKVIAIGYVMSKAFFTLESYFCIVSFPVFLELHMT